LQSADNPSPLSSTLSVVDLATQRQLAQVEVAGVTRVVAFSNDGKYLALGSDKTASLRLAHSGEAVATFPIGAYVRSLAISPDNAMLAVGSDDNQARVFDIASRRQRFVVEYPQFMSPETGVRALAFSPNSDFLASGTADDQAQVSAVSSGVTVGRLAHPAAVLALAFSPDGQSVVSGAADNMARVFTNGRWRETVRIAFAHPVERVAFSPDGFHVIAASRMAVRVANLRTGIERIRFESLQGIGAVAIDPHSQLFAVGAGRSARVLTLHASNEVESKLTEPEPPTSPDGLRVTVGEFGQGALVIDAKTRQRVASLDLGEFSFGGACFTAGGSQIVVASNAMNLSETRLTAFESRTGRIVWRNTSESGWWRHECSLDGQLFAVATRRQVLLINAATGRTIARLEHEAEVKSLAFNRDGTRLATGADDGYVHVYLVNEAREIVRMPLGESVQRVEFERDGRRLRATTGSFDVGRETWNYRSSLEPIEATDLIADACTRLTRNLTTDQWATFIAGTYRETCPGLARDAAAAAPPR
jgi:WD40 repeat protein